MMSFPIARSFHQISVRKSVKCWYFLRRLLMNRCYMIIIIIIIIITTTMFMVLSSWHSHCESSPGSFDECRLSAGWLPTLRPNQLIWAVSPPKEWLLPSADTIAIYYYYSARKLILILPSHRRLSWPRHCSKGAQPVPKAVYRSDCRDKHDRSSLTAVGRPTTKPPRPAVIDWLIDKC